MSGYGYKNQPSKFAPPTAGAVGMSTAQPRCSQCDQDIIFLQIVKKDGTLGKPMPVDPVQRYGDGTRHLVVRFERGRKVFGRLETYAGEDVLGFEPHFGTCPVRLRQRAIAKAATKSAAKPTPGATIFSMPPRDGGAK